MKASFKAHIAVLLTNLFFAINYSFVKKIAPSLIGPYGLNILRVGGSLLLFWAAWVFSKEKSRPAKKDIGRFILCGLLGVALNQMLFIKGLTMTTAIHASLLMLCSPILITLLAFLILRETVSLVNGAGLALGIAGSVWLILGQRGGHQPANYLLGDLLVVLNAISYAFYFVLVRPLMKRYSPLEVIRWVFSFGFLMMLPLGWPQVQSVNWSAFTLSSAGILFFVIFAGTFLAYLFNAYGIHILGPGITSAYIYVQLLFAVSIAVLFFGEELTTEKTIAGLLILLGVYLATLRKRE